MEEEKSQPHAHVVKPMPQTAGAEQKALIAVGGQKIGYLIVENEWQAQACRLFSQLRP